jgi:hypothetical protein
MEIVVVLLVLGLLLLSSRLYRHRRHKPPMQVRVLNTVLMLVLGAPAGWALLMGPFQVVGALWANQPQRAPLGVAMIIAGGCGCFLVGQVVRWVERALRPADARDPVDDEAAPASRRTIVAVATIGLCATGYAVASLMPSAALAGPMKTVAAVGGAAASLLMFAGAAGVGVVAWKRPTFRVWLGMVAVLAPPIAWFALGMNDGTWGIVLVIFGPVYVLVCVLPMLLYARRRLLAARG